MGLETSVETPLLINGHETPSDNLSGSTIYESYIKLKTNIFKNIPLI